MEILSGQRTGESWAFQDRTRANAFCCSCRARRAAAGGSFLFLLCDAQVCFAIGRLILLRPPKSDLASSSELRSRHALRARTLATGLLLLPSSSTLSRTWACSAVLCTVWACAEALGSRSESRVDVPGRLLACDAV